MKSIQDIKLEVKNNLLYFDSLQDRYRFYSINAYNLLLGTIAQESNFKYEKQLNGGPARSFFQIEPASAKDILVNYISYYDKNKKIQYRAEILLILRRISNLTIQEITNPTNARIEEELLTNFKFATLIARLLYYRRPFNFDTGKKEELAQIWKKYYNTIYGKGKEEEFIENYKKYVEKA